MILARIGVVGFLHRLEVPERLCTVPIWPSGRRIFCPTSVLGPTQWTPSWPVKASVTALVTELGIYTKKHPVRSWEATAIVIMDRAVILGPVRLGRRRSWLARGFCQPEAM